LTGSCTLLSTVAILSIAVAQKCKSLQRSVGSESTVLPESTAQVGSTCALAGWRLVLWYMCLVLFTSCDSSAEATSDRSPPAATTAATAATTAASTAAAQEWGRLETAHRGRATWCRRLLPHPYLRPCRTATHTQHAHCKCGFIGRGDRPEPGHLTSTRA
jgi:hypothetical protein